MPTWNVIIVTRRTALDGVKTASIATGAYTSDRLPAEGETITLNAQGTTATVEEIVGGGDSAVIRAARDLGD